MVDVADAQDSQVDDNSRPDKSEKPFTEVADTLYRPGANTTNFNDTFQSDTIDLPKLEIVSEDFAVKDTTDRDMERLGEKYGLKSKTVKDADGNPTNRFYVEGSGGREIPVLDSNASPAEIDKLLAAKQKAELERVEKTYGVAISRDGSTAQGNLGKQLEVRQPRFDELYALEQSLSTAQPSQQRADGKPLSFNFLVKPELPAPGYFMFNDKGPAIFIEPAKRSFDDQVSLNSHELAHNGQNTLTDADPNFARNYDSDLGFKRVEVKEGGETVEKWLLQGKEPGEYYAVDRSDDKNMWNKVDSDGNILLDESGKPIRISNEDVHERARVTPATMYHPNPGEMGAEGMVKYRGGAETRTQLYKDSPQLYEAMKKYDQQELDRAYGAGQYIRNQDGKIVANSAENRQQLAEFERKIKSGPGDDTRTRMAEKGSIYSN